MSKVAVCKFLLKTLLLIMNIYQIEAAFYSCVQKCLHMSIFYIFSELNRGDTNTVRLLTQSSACVKHNTSHARILQESPLSDPEICELSRGCGKTHLHLEISDVFLPVRPHLLISVSSEILYVPSGSREKTQNITNKPRTVVLPCFYRAKLTFCGTYKNVMQYEVHIQ